MTSEKSDLNELKKILLSREAFHPFPKYDEREAWDALPEDTRQYYLSMQDELLQFETSALSAVKYMGYARTNKAWEYHTHISARREALMNAVLCECIAHDGKLIDKIIDLIWATCEESSWVDPDHNNHMHDHMLSGKIQNALPDVLDYNFVDLVAGSTCSMLAWTYYFLKEPLDRETPMVCERIELEILKRIVIPFMHHDDMTWFGCYGHKINNWNPWITGNIVCADLICVKDPDLRAKMFSRAMEKLDIYIRILPEDGGCDEGPGYWGAAGAALYDCLAIFYAATDGKLNFFTQPLIRAFGEYIAKANLWENRYANFADNGPDINTDTLMLWRYGRDVQSEMLTAFALSRHRHQVEKVEHRHCFRSLENLFCIRTVDALAEKAGGFVPGCYYLPDTQVLFARDNQNRVQFAAKGGFNNESHNHNDLGHFILLREGEPIFPDLGCLPYTARTFSPYRYEIWILTSAWHSCARINGFDQHDGDTYKAQVLAYSESDKTIELSLELKGAYEAEAGIQSYTRAFRFDRESGALSIRDHMELLEPGEAEIHFVTVAEPTVGAGLVTVPVKDGRCTMTYAPENLTVTTESHELESEGLKKCWKVEQCCRISLTSGKKQIHDFAVEIQA